jgi:hypothetical protein
VIAVVLLGACLLAPVNAADNGFDKVILSQEYTLGLGGMAIIEYRPYLLFKDGSILRSPSEAPADVDVGRSRAARSRDWGRYTITGDRIQAQWGDGKSQTIDKWWTARPAKSGASLSGLYRYSGGSGTTALGGSAMVVSRSRPPTTSLPPVASSGPRFDDLAKVWVDTREPVSTFHSAGRQSPSADFSAPVTRNGSALVTRIDHLLHADLMTFEHAQALPAFQIPQAHSPIKRGRQDRLLVAAPGDAFDNFRMATQHAQAATAIEVPESDIARRR